MSLSLLSPTSGQLNLDLLQKALKIACFGLPNELRQSPDPSQTVTTDKKDEEMADVEDKDALVDLPALENRKRHLDDSLKRARKRLKPRGSFDQEYWTWATETDFRPAARYLYFHYVIQLLRYAWQSDSQGGEQAIRVMKGEHGKPYWGTPGRYLPKNMLLALAEELGHEYKPILDGASPGC
ncbi:hypothetical protein MYU51_008693 [Penicillium brevicompactum]